jgi:UDP-N-acetylmuramyl pentapeptide phosphotransferase/UDP-N-acetylglucosamine-1-phosphate transferase
MNRSTERFGRDSLAGFFRKLWRYQNRSVRFWIISMMLVLIGLSSLKLR